MQREKRAIVQVMMCTRIIRLLILCLFALLSVGSLRAGSDTLSERDVVKLADSYLNPSTLISTKESDRPHLYPSPGTVAIDNPPSQPQPDCPPDHQGYTINYEDIDVEQLIHFISKISGTNYIYDKKDLNFKITIVSEDATSVTDLSSALLQILKINGFSVIEQGNNVMIYRPVSEKAALSKVSKVITDANVDESCQSAIITRVFRLYNVDPAKIAPIVVPLVSAGAVVDISEETSHLIVTDITANVNKIAELLAAIDTPLDASIDIAEYDVNTAYPGVLVEYAKEILIPFHSPTQPLLLIPQTSAKKIFVVSSPYLIQKTLQVLAALDTPEITEAVDLPATSMANNNLLMYKLKYQSGGAIAAALQDIGNNLKSTGVSNIEFVNTIYSVQYIEVNNSLILSGTQDAIDKVVELIDDLDVAPKQVYIEVLIIDTTLQNSLDFGVQWIALGDEQDDLAYASGLLSDSPTAPILAGGPTTNPGARFVAANPANNPPSIPNAGRDLALPFPANLSGFTTLADQTAAFGLGIIGNIIRHNGQSFLTLGALLSALDEESDTSIILNPRIMVEDSQPASFFVGENIPYQTTSTVIQQTGSVTQNIQYEDIGVNLQVTPNISPNNMVTLDIVQSIAENTSPSGSLTPTTSKTLANTRVHVPDGTFLVMSGSIRDQTTNIHSGVPCLGSLPLIGPTFSRTIDQRKKRNLMLFVRPKVITNIYEGIDLTNEEGCMGNWENNPCSMYEPPMELPECEEYPPLEPSAGHCLIPCP